MLISDHLKKTNFVDDEIEGVFYKIETDTELFSNIKKKDKLNFQLTEHVDALNSVIPLRTSTIEYGDFGDSEGEGKLDVSKLLPISNNEENLYTKIAIARALLKDIIGQLSQAEQMREEIVEREEILNGSFHKIYKLYAFKDIGNNFRKVTQLLMKVIKTKGTDVFDTVEIRIIKNIIQNILEKMNDFSEEEIAKIILKLEDYSLYITG